MPNGTQPSNPASGQQPTGVTPTGQTQQAITEPRHQMMAAGQDLINTAIAGDDPNQLQALRNMDNAIISQMQQRWWKSQDDQFTQTHGQTYQQSAQSIQAGYMDELARASDIKEPYERAAAMNAAHGRMWSELGKADQGFLDKAGKYSNNPIISSRAAQLIQTRTQLMGKIAGERAQPSQQVGRLSQAEAAQAQAGASRAQAGAKAGFYNTATATAAAQVPMNRARDFILTVPGGREELASETQHLMAEREASIGPAYRLYQETLDSGNMKRANEVAKAFKQRFLIDPEMIGDKDSEELITFWRAEAEPALEKEAALNVYNRLIDASRGFAPQAQTTAPRAPGGVRIQERSPQVDTQEAGKPRPRILQKGAAPKLEARAQFARELGETRDLPEFDVSRAVTAMGGDTPEEVQTAGDRAFSMLSQQMLREGLEPPPEWDAEPSIEVAEFAKGTYDKLPTYREHEKERGEMLAKDRNIVKWFDNMSDRIRSVFMIPVKLDLPGGLDRNDMIWMNLITLHGQYLKKFPKSNISIEQMVSEALKNLAAREISKEKFGEESKARRRIRQVHPH